MPTELQLGDLPDVMHAVRQVTNALLRRNAEELEAWFGDGRGKPADYFRALAKSPATFVFPPENYSQQAPLYALDDGPGWWADLGLWSVEEGQSDLTLQFEVYQEQGVRRLQILDLHVL